MTPSKLRFSFAETSVRDANIHAADLESILRRAISDAQISREKNPDTQDAGATLIAVLAAPVLVELVKGPLTELAKALSNWIAKSRVNISINDVKIENAKPEHIESVLRQLLKK